MFETKYEAQVPTTQGWKTILTSTDQEMVEREAKESAMVNTNSYYELGTRVNRVTESKNTKGVTTEITIHPVCRFDHEGNRFDADTLGAYDDEKYPR